MADVDVWKVGIREAQNGEWFAESIGRNGEPLARSTDTYSDIRDAFAVGQTMSEGAPVVRQKKVTGGWVDVKTDA